MRAAPRVVMVVVLVLATVLVQLLVDGLLAKETVQALAQKVVLLQLQLYHLVLDALESVKVLVILNALDVKMDVKALVEADAAVTALTIAALLAPANLINNKKNKGTYIK